MIPIYLFNASPWGSLTKGYRLLKPSSQREMREKNPYRVQRWRVLLLIVYRPCFLVSGNREHEDCGKHAREYSKGPRTQPCILKNAEGAILFPFAVRANDFAWPNVLGCILQASVLIVLLHKPKEGAWGWARGPKTQQRDAASSLGIFLEKNVP